LEYRGLTLDGFQTEAIEALNRGQSVLVAAPTGTGKTVVADYIVEQALREGRDVIYTAPIKALSNQKFRDYCALFGEEKVGLVTGDLVIRRDAPCRVMTTEILRNMLLAGEQLQQLAAVVIDEIHFLDDRDRGTVWEEVLIYLPKHVRIVGLSATLSNLNEFAAWLGKVRGEPVHVVLEEKRAVPLAFQIATKQLGLTEARDMDREYKSWHKHHAKNARHKVKEKWNRKKGRDQGHVGRRDRKPRMSAPTRHFHIFRMLVDTDNLPYLYFVFSRQHAEQLARDLGGDVARAGILTADEHEKIETRLDAFEERVGKGVLSQEHRKLLCNGVGFHHAGLHVHLKTITEQLYEARLLKVLYCTGTFALGINMPARAACFDAMLRFDGRKLIPLPAREFMQMAGRAGRRGLDDFGQVVIRTDIEDWPEIEPQLKAYLTGLTEPVKSRFSLSFNSVVNLLHRHPPEQVREVVEKSFLAWFRQREADQHASNAAQLQTSVGAVTQAEEEVLPKHAKKQLRRAKRLEQRAADTTDRTWEEFQAKVEFLKKWGYLAEDGSFKAGAHALREIQISEIFTTELFLNGVFDDLEPDRLFGVLTGMCNTLNKRVEVHTTKADRRAGGAVAKVLGSDVLQAAESLTQAETTWDSRMIGLGTMWAQGKSLAEIMAYVSSPTDVTGDLVGAFRRARELVGQLKALWGDDEMKTAQINRLIREVTRDEVAVVG
jgi:ATP-dependent RNA helicase HelY